MNLSLIILHCKIVCSNKCSEDIPTSMLHYIVARNAIIHNPYILCYGILYTNTIHYRLDSPLMSEAMTISGGVQTVKTFIYYRLILQKLNDSLFSFFIHQITLRYLFTDTRFELYYEFYADFYRFH
jgi:hypothetical protein